MHGRSCIEGKGRMKGQDSLDDVRGEGSHGCGCVSCTRVDGVGSELINGFPRVSEVEFLEAPNLNYASVS